MGQVLVTGGCGFIGSHIVKALLEQGMSVRVFDNLSTGRLSNINSICDEIELIEGDLRDTSLIHQSMKNIEVVYHQGALASVPRSVEDPKTTHEVCVTGTLNVLEAAKDNQVRRVVYAASSSAYGSLEAPTKTEMSPLLPCSPYAAAKLCGELYCQAFTEVYGIETVRLRYFNVFGPNQDPNSPYSAVIPLFITAMLQGQTPRIFGDGPNEAQRSASSASGLLQAYLGKTVRSNAASSSATVRSRLRSAAVWGCSSPVTSLSATHDCRSATAASYAAAIFFHSRKGPHMLEAWRSGS